MPNMYDMAVSIWKQKNIQTDAELAAALNGYSIAFAYHSGNIENSHVTYNDSKRLLCLRYEAQIGDFCDTSDGSDGCDSYSRTGGIPSLPSQPSQPSPASHPSLAS